MRPMAALIQVTAWERTSLGRRLLCAFLRVGILIVAVMILIATLGPPLGFFFTARWEAEKVPAVWVTQRPLTNYAVCEAPGRKLSYFGYEFEVPWTSAFKEKGGKHGLLLLNFESGQSVILISPTNHAGLLSELVEDPSMQMKGLQPILGELTKVSAYDQYAAVLNTTPSSIRSFGPRAQAVRGETLLTIKAIAFPAGLGTGVFSFDLPDKRGFQIGDPQKSRSTQLEVFDRSGSLRVEIICETANDRVKLTQPEINRIVKTLQVASEQSSAAVTALPTPRR